MKIPYDDPTSLGREHIALRVEFAAAILLTLQAGWARAAASADVHAAAGEVAMTERLRDGMRAALKADLVPWAKNMIVPPGTESRSTPEQLLPDGRTDIPIYLIEIFLTQGEHDPHAIIECKRIAGSDAHLCREYVIEGVDRFRTGKYGENHAAGFMAGYLVDGNDVAAAGGINSFLRRQLRATECLAVSDVVDQPGFWQSRHPRASPRDPIDLHHAFFETVLAAR